MSLLIEQEAPPLAANPDGVVLVGNTRVPLETVVHFFDRGCTAEEIVRKFPTLELADVFATLSYVLRHRAQIDAYLEESDRQSEAARRFWESRTDQSGLKETLLARREAMKGTDG